MLPVGTVIKWAITFAEARDSKTETRDTYSAISSEHSAGLLSSNRHSYLCGYRRLVISASHAKVRRLPICFREHLIDNSESSKM